MTGAALMPLAVMRSGDSGVLKDIRGLRHHDEHGARAGARKHRVGNRERHLLTTDRGHQLEHRLNYMGLVPGVQVTVIQNTAPGPMIIAVKGSRLCLSRGVAIRLMIMPDAEGGDAR